MLALQLYAHMHNYHDMIFPITAMTNNMAIMGAHIVTTVTQIVIQTTAQYTRYIMTWGILYTISMFNIYDSKAEADDLHYISKSKRSWVHGLTASLHNKMELIIDKVYNYTTNWPTLRPIQAAQG